MDKSFFVFLVIGAAFLYVVTTFVGDLQKEDDKAYQYSQQQAAKYAKYKTVDSVGQAVIDVSEASDAMQIEVWNHSGLKDEFIRLFPNFEEMRFFIRDRIIGKGLQDKLLKLVAEVEDGVISGAMSVKQAKIKLGLLK